MLCCCSTIAAQSIAIFLENKVYPSLFVEILLSLKLAPVL